MAPLEPSPRPQWRSLALIGFVVVVGAAMSLTAFLLLRQAQDRQIRHGLDLRAEWRAKDLQAKVSAAAQDLFAIEAWAAVSSDPTEVGFFDFARTRFSRSSTPPQFLVWASRVGDGGGHSGAIHHARILAPKARSKVRSQASEGTTSPAMGQVGAFRVALTATPGGAPLRLSLTPRDHAILGKAIDHAVDTGGLGGAGLQNRLTSPITHRPGLFENIAVYRTKTVPNDLQARRSDVRGLVGGWFDLADLLNSAIVNTPPMPEQIFVLRRLSSDAKVAEVAAVFDPSVRAFSAVESRLNLKTLGGYNVIQSFDLGGETWTLVSHFSPHYLSADRTPAPWVALFLGSFLTLLLAAYLYNEMYRIMNIESVVSRRTYDLQLSQMFLNTVIENIPAGIFVKDALDRHYVMVNRHGETLLGFGPGQLIGKTSRDLVPKTQVDAFLVHDQVALDTRTIQIIPQIDINTQHQGPRTLEVKTVAVFDNESAPKYLITFADDITDRLATAHQLVQAQKMEAVGHLTGGLAHDFNNLLGVIIGNLDLLQLRADRDGEETLMIADALSAAMKGAELTRSLLAFARRQPLQAATIDVNVMIGSLANLARRTLGETITIEVRQFSALWPVKADPSRLEATILNLCLNARDAMPHGGTLTLATSNAHLDEDYAANNAEVVAGDYVLISVTDNGSGMSEDILASATQPFFSTKEKGKGTGLGLSMALGFIKQSGGHFKIYSEVDFGTTVKLYLPRAGSADQATTAENQPAAPQVRPHETILVVDDQEPLRRVVLKQLRNLGYRTIAAEDGATALSVLSGDARIDLLFTDIVMPGGISGLDLASAADALRPGLKILFTSGFADGVARPAPELAQPAHLLSKPYRLDELALKLREILDATVGTAP